MNTLSIPTLPRNLQPGGAPSINYPIIETGGVITPPQFSPASLSVVAKADTGGEPPAWLGLFIEQTGAPFQFAKKLLVDGRLCFESGEFVIPVVDLTGATASAYRLSMLTNQWILKCSGGQAQPLIFGDAAMATRVFIAPHPGELLPAMYLLEWHVGGCPDTLFVATDGLVNPLMSAIRAPDAAHPYILHDRSTQTLSWLGAVNSALEGRGFVVTPPPNEFGGFSSWFRKGGATSQEFTRLVEQAGPSPLIASFANTAPTVEISTWEAPIPFGQYDLPPFPVDVLTPWSREFVKALSTATQTPIDVAGVFFLAIMALCAAKAFRVRVRSGWLEPVNLYALVIQPSGARKSPVVSELSAPVRDYEREEIQRHLGPFRELAARRDLLAKRVESLKKAAAKAKPEDRPGLEEQAVKLSLELERMPVPVMPRLLVDDITAEKVAVQLHEQGGRIGFLSAEGGVFDLMAGKYMEKGTPNFEVYLKGHAGEDIRVDRVQRATDYVEEAAITMALMAQPDILHCIGRNPALRGRGLPARFLFANPVSLVGHRVVNAPPVKEDLRRSYHERLRRLLNLRPFSMEGKYPAPMVLELSAEAHDVLANLEANLEPRLGAAGDLGAIADWGGKLVGAVARIAGLLHVADHADLQTPTTPVFAATQIPTTISEKTVSRAIQIGHYLIPHAKSAFSEMELDKDLADARYLLRWVERHGQPSFTVREAFEATKGRFHRVAKLEKPLWILVEHHYLREQSAAVHCGPGRPRSPVFEVNPDLFAKYSHNSHNANPATAL